MSRCGGASQTPGGFCTDSGVKGFARTPGCWILLGVRGGGLWFFTGSGHGLRTGALGSSLCRLYLSSSLPFRDPFSAISANNQQQSLCDVRSDNGPFMHIITGLERMTASELEHEQEERRAQEALGLVRSGRQTPKRQRGQGGRQDRGLPGLAERQARERGGARDDRRRGGEREKWPIDAITLARMDLESMWQAPGWESCASLVFGLCLLDSACNTVSAPLSRTHQRDPL